MHGEASSALCAPRSSPAPVPEVSDGAGAVRRHGPSRRSATQVNGSNLLRVTPASPPRARRGRQEDTHSSPSVPWLGWTPSWPMSRHCMAVFRDVRARAPPVRPLPDAAVPAGPRPVRVPASAAPAGRVVSAGVRRRGTRALGTRSRPRGPPGALPTAAAAPVERVRRRRREGSVVDAGAVSGSDSGTAASSVGTASAMGRAGEASIRASAMGQAGEA